MTESSSKGLTWATFVAGVASAVLLAAIGCVKPASMREEAKRLRSGLAPAAMDVGKAQPRYVSQESIQR